MSIQVGDEVYITSLENIRRSSSIDVTSTMRKWYEEKKHLTVYRISDAENAGCRAVSGLNQVIPLSALRLVDRRTDDEKYLENLL